MRTDAIYGKGGHKDMMPRIRFGTDGAPIVALDGCGFSYGVSWLPGTASTFPPSWDHYATGEWEWECLGLSFWRMSNRPVSAGERGTW